MELRKNWETWFRLQQRLAKEDLTIAEGESYNKSKSYVFDHEKDFNVSYSLLIPELMEYLKLVTKSNAWKLDIVEGSIDSDDYYYDIALVNDDDKKLRIARIESDVENHVNPAYSQIANVETSKTTINLLKNSKFSDITLSRVMKQKENLPFSMDGLMEVLWKVIKQNKLINLLNKKEDISLEMEKAQQTLIDLKKERYRIVEELEDLNN